MKTTGRNLHRVYSFDAERVLNDYPDLDVYELETALNKSYSQNIKLLLKKKNPEACFAMINNGYCKNINKRTEVDFTDKNIKRVYNLVTTMYLDSCFIYEQLSALIDISKFDSVTILKTADSLKIKNMWYLRKVLLLNNNISDYTLVNEVDIKSISDKGELINKSFLNEYKH